MIWGAICAQAGPQNWTESLGKWTVQFTIPFCAEKQFRPAKDLRDSHFNRKMIQNTRLLKI
jgi:hypothetical protein